MTQPDRLPGKDAGRRHGESTGRTRAAIPEILHGLEEWLGRKPAWKTPCILVLVYGAIHAGYAFSGVGLTDLSSLSWGWHFIDPGLLIRRPIQSLFYLHTQPPLQNAFLAVLLRFPGHLQPALWTAGYAVLGLLFYACLFFLMVNLGISRLLALSLGTLFVASPSFMLLERGVSYDFPVAAITVVSGFLLLRFLRSSTFRTGSAFFGALTLLCLTRSLFHLVFILLVAGLIIVRHPRLLRTVILSACLPLLLVFSWYAKNYFVFGKFTASTWMGMNASKIVSRSSSMEQRETWVREGTCSPLMLIEPWSDLASYPPAYRAAEARYAGIPLLCLQEKESGYKNLHDVAYIAIADQYLHDVVSIARAHPISYLKGYASSWFCYFRATDESNFLGYEDNVRWLVTFYDSIFYGKSPWPIPFKTDRRDAYNVYLFLLVGLPLVLWYGVRLGSRRSALGHGEKTLVFYMIGVIVFVALVINAFELAENQRARFYTDGFSLVLLAHLLHSIPGWIRERWTRRRGAGEGSVLG